MSAAATLPTRRVEPAGRPTAARLLLDQAGYAVRELWRSRIVLVFTFVLPLVWLILIGILAGNEVLDEATGLRVMQFATPTAVVMGILFATYPPVATSLAQAREQRILKRLAGTPLPATAYLFGRAMAALVLSLASIAVMLAVGVVGYGVQVVWATLPATIVTAALGIVSLAMLGLAVGAVAPSASAAQSFAMATGVGVTFLSGMFMIGSTPPAWLDAIAHVFPVVHLSTALQDQFDPFKGGSGWEPGALVVIAAWGIGGLLVAAWALRREPGTAPGRGSSQGRAAETAAAILAPRLRAVAAARPSPLRLVLDQAAWATRGLLRDLGDVFFAILMPVGLYALMATMYGDTGFRPRDHPFSFYFACGMAVYGIAVTGFVNNPQIVARNRDRGVLKRLRGTPIAQWQYMAGRTAATVAVGVVTAALVLGVGVAFFGVDLAGPAWLVLAAAVTLLGTLTLVACGYVLVSLAPSQKAQATIGLGILLPLSFFSDIFVFGSIPDWMSTVGAAFPLLHFVRALAAALDPVAPSIAWLDLAVLAAWLVGAALVAMRWFRWSPRT